MSKNILSLMKKINKGIKKADSYDSGLLGEKIIVSAYETMTIENLERLRYVLNGTIKKKKELKRVQKYIEEQKKQKEIKKLEVKNE